jgi:ATP-dependent RNA helicase DeaD
LKFTEFDLKPEILSGLAEMGYEDMTPIQEQAIPHILAGRDVVGLAETGSGKTSACAIPMVNMTDTENRVIQHLILVPTRELALQYVQEIDDVAKNSGVVPFAVFGGFDIGVQKSKLNHGVHILVATPGRLIDLIWNTKIDMQQVRTVVLDEADEMLDMGFIEDVDFILSCMLQQYQVLLFSATMPAEIEKLTTKYLKDPVKVVLNRDQGAPSSLQHHFLHVRGDRTQQLLDFLSDEEDVNQVIVFCNSRDKGGELYRTFRRTFRNTEYIHGGLDQDRRISIFDRFKERKIKFMIATDVAGRGLDFSHVTHVINFDFPFNPEIYAHRTGRTGRMGRIGTALTMVTDRDLGNLKRLLTVREISPEWRGREPDLTNVKARSGSGRRRAGAPVKSNGAAGRQGAPPHREPSRARSR